MSASFHHIETPAGMVAVRFISRYCEVNDYGIVLCRSRFHETRISTDTDGAIIPHVCADRFISEYGLAWADAVAAVQTFIALRFDEEVRELARMGILSFCDDAHILRRAVELGCSA